MASLLEHAEAFLFALYLYFVYWLGDVTRGPAAREMDGVWTLATLSQWTTGSDSKEKMLSSRLSEQKFTVSGRKENSHHLKDLKVSSSKWLSPASGAGVMDVN